MSSRPKPNRPLRLLDRRVLALVHGGENEGAGAPGTGTGSTAIYVGDGRMVHAPQTGEHVRMTP